MHKKVTRLLFITVISVSVSGCDLLESDKAKELRQAHETIEELRATIDQMKTINEDLRKQIVTADQLELQEDVELLKSLLVPPSSG